MNVWDWVVDLEDKLEEQGNSHLVEVIDGVSAAVHEDDFARVDALVAEGIAASQSLGIPWLEVYFRHWDLQSRVLDRCQGETALKDSVYLFELAHRDENLGCPQRVCATQDLAHVWGAVDGPGYAPERLAVTAETLAGITPAWSCWNCIAIEHADALIDAERADEVIPWIELQQKARRAAGEDPEDDRYFDQRVLALLALGRPAEALARIEGLTDEELAEAREGERLRWRLYKARCLAELARLPEAAAALPPLEELSQLPGTWTAAADAMRALLTAGAIEPSPALAGDVLRFFAALEERGALRRSFEMGALFVEICVALRARALAGLMLERIGVLIERLKAQDGPRARLAALEARAEHLVPWAPPRGASAAEAIALANAQELAAAEPAVAPLNEPGPVIGGVNPPAGAIAPLDAFERADALLAYFPGDPEIAVPRAELLYQLGFRQTAMQDLLRWLDRHSDQTALLALGFMAARSKDEGLVGAAVARAQASQDAIAAAWIQAGYLLECSRFEEARPYLDEVLRLEPRARNARKEAARVAKLTERWDDLLEHAQVSAAQDADDLDARWQICVAATVLGRWELVRRAATEIGMPVPPGEGAIDAPGEIIRILFPDSDPRGTHARRNGPVSARIVELPDPEDPLQNHGDVVVFDPAPLEVASRDDPDSTFLFPYLTTLHHAGRQVVEAFVSDPSEPALEALSERFEAAGMEVLFQEPRSRWLRADGSTFKPWRLAISVPSAMTVAELCGWLARHTAELGLAAVWPALARAAGAPEDAPEASFFEYEERLDDDG